ncbi:hypothetical protein FOCC_FOCC006477 [Frankliniella occidentalis]|nr:hypothetical protein FOCC_FOCC006477 [Frankliniella occidentalis]
MLSSQARTLRPIAVGDNVTVSASRVDRASCDPQNVLAVVTEVTDNGLHRVGNAEGTLDRLSARNQVHPTEHQFIRLEDVPEQDELAPRTMATAASHSGGQGYE